MADEEMQAFDEQEELSTLDEFEESEATSVSLGRSLALQPMFSELLQVVTDELWPADSVMAEFVAQVVPQISALFGHVAAKGGFFAEAQQSLGRAGVARYLADQSMRAHLINGLFPVLHVAQALQNWGAPQFRAYDEKTRRIFIAGYVLHDYLKFPASEQELQATHLGAPGAHWSDRVAQLEELFTTWCDRLGLDRFLSPIGGAAPWLQDLIYVASNTQVRWGTLRNTSLLERLRLGRVQLDLAEQLSRLADLLSYVIRTPPQATSEIIHRELSIVSDGMARLTYHHLADNRGILTNFIHNAAIRELEHPFRRPLLFAPSGVIYLENVQHAPALPDVSHIVEHTIAQIRSLAGSRLAESKAGFKRDGKGLKYADFYWWFFDLPGMLRLSVDAAFRLIRTTSTEKRYEKIRAGAWLPEPVDWDLPQDMRVDLLAEWCYLAEKLAKAVLPDFPADAFLLNAMGLNAVKATFDQVPRDNRAGGVGYHWFLAAGNFIKSNPQLSPADLEQMLRDLADRLGEAINRLGSALIPANAQDAWNDLRVYLAQILTLGGQAQKVDLRQAVQVELDRYSKAKLQRGSAKVCALCSSSLKIDKQQEAAVLFQPQVFSNKMPLGGVGAIRNICSICSLEMMLRLNLMNRAFFSGAKFEQRRMRYLYIYPMYFFTPETLRVVRRVLETLGRVRLADIRRQLVPQGGQVDFSPSVLQRLQEVLLTPELADDPSKGIYLQLRFPPTEPVTFCFIGIPPGRDAKDAEAWVLPALLSLLLPLCMDIKVVASESGVPLLLEADEISETVFLDAPHPAIQYVTRKARLNIDEVLPTLQRLLAAYFIHIDANASQGKGRYDYRWQALPGVTRNLSVSPLYVFYYLKKSLRNGGKDLPASYKVAEYLCYLACLGEDPMTNHARQLTQLYRQFYRAKNWNSNSILQPITKTARVILDADPRLFGTPESLEEAVYGELHAFIERAYQEKLAFPPAGSTREGQQAAMREFARYFVHKIFYEVFRGDRSALRGKQLNLLKNACEVVYLDESAKDRAEHSSVEAGV